MADPASEKSNPTEIPSFKKSPIMEVVCGLRFDTLKNFKIHHIGLLWNKFHLEYPRVEEAQPIITPSAQIEVSSVMLPRVWFIKNSDDELVQFQRDRFYFNWRRKIADYPRYYYIIKKFEETFITFESFFKEYDLGDLNPIEYELSYINHLPIGEGWDQIEDLNKIFPSFIWEQRTDRYLTHPKDIFFNMAFPLKDNMGKLLVSMKKAIRVDDKRDLIIIEMRATGNAGLIDKKEHRKWFDIAHESIVRGFTDITSTEMHNIWQREK